MKYFFALAILVSLAVVGCQSTSEHGHNDAHEKNENTNNGSKVPTKFTVEVVELTDEQYPDNPDIGFRSPAYGQVSHSTLQIEREMNGNFSFTFLPGNEHSDTISFPDVNVKAYMPSTPEWVKEDPYLTYLGIINQEWNRQQVRYDKAKNYWEVRGNGYDASHVVRIDLARNCLNSGLWELIAFEEDENGNTQPYYHGWFLFPMDLYAHLFEDVNQLDWEDYESGMIDWEEPERKEINYALLRTVKKEMEVEARDLNDQYYPLTGARKKKEKNIIKPKKHEKIQDFLSDETLFSTFSPPGFYNTEDPRQTFLSLLADFQGAKVREIENEHAVYDSTLLELELTFHNSDGTKITKVVFGGIDLALVPTLSLEDNNSGYKMPMGIANHAFYESYERMLANSVMDNPYYAFVTDEKNVWFDSHALGIDGPLLFWDKAQEDLLHVFIMSFERHAFVGHFTLQF